MKTTRALVVLAAAGCGAASQPLASPARPADDAALDGGAAEAGPRIDESYATLDVIAARGPSEAPLMRELLRVERAAPRSPEVRADRDLCLRALFAAPKPVRAWFADQAGGVRGDPATGTTGAVPPRGPVCARKGEVLHLVIEGAPPDVGPARAVIFAAP